VDGSAYGNPLFGAIGGVFGDWQTNFLGGFAENIGYATCLQAEFCATMYAIEKSLEMNWNNIWIECLQPLSRRSLLALRCPGNSKLAGIILCLWFNKEVVNALIYIEKETRLQMHWLRMVKVFLFTPHSAGLPLPLLFFPFCLGIMLADLLIDL